MRKSILLSAAILLASTAANAGGGLHWDAVLQVPAIETARPGIFQVCPPGSRFAEAAIEPSCVATPPGQAVTKPRALSLQEALEWHLGALPEHIAVARGPLPAAEQGSVLVAYKRYPKAPFTRKDI